eukprot:6213375-Amphidinium_carterae.1
MASAVVLPTTSPLLSYEVYAGKQATEAANDKQINQCSKRYRTHFGVSSLATLLFFATEDNVEHNHRMLSQILSGVNRIQDSVKRVEDCLASNGFSQVGEQFGAELSNGLRSQCC